MRQVPRYAHDQKLEVAMGRLGVCGQCTASMSYAKRRAANLPSTQYNGLVSIHKIGIWQTRDLALMVWVMIPAGKNSIAGGLLTLEAAVSPCGRCGHL